MSCGIFVLASSYRVHHRRRGVHLRAQIPTPNYHPLTFIVKGAVSATPVRPCRPHHAPTMISRQFIFPSRRHTHRNPIFTRARSCVGMGERDLAVETFLSPCKTRLDPLPGALNRSSSHGVRIELLRLCSPMPRSLLGGNDTNRISSRVFFCPVDAEFDHNPLTHPNPLERRRTAISSYGPA